MKVHISVITLGVRDLNRAKQFYSQGLGWPIHVDQGYFVSFSPANGSSAVGLYPWEVLADDAGVSADGSGFHGVVLSSSAPTSASMQCWPKPNALAARLPSQRTAKSGVGTAATS